MAHCREPARCSVCLATPFQRVTVVDGVTYVDGKPVRASQPDTAMSQRSRDSAQRGANRRGRRR